LQKSDTSRAATLGPRNNVLADAGVNERLIDCCLERRIDYVQVS